MPQKLFKYISLAFIKSLLLFHIGVAFIIFIADFTENVRISGTANIGNLLILSLLNIPYLIVQISPFVLLLASFTTIRFMVLRKEVDILKSFGISIWQFLMPFTLISCIWAVIVILVVAPLAVDSMTLKSKLNTKADETSQQITTTDRYIWIVDKFNNNSNIIATKNLNIDKNITHLHPAIFLEIKDNKFQGAVFAERGEMEKSQITFFNAVSKFKDDFYPVKLSEITRASFLSSNSLTNISVEPFMVKTLDFPKVIAGLKAISFASFTYEVYFYNLLTLPLLFITMLLIATRFSLYDVRAGKNLFAIFSAIVVGFMVYFFINLGNVSFGIFGISPLSAVFASKIITLLIALNVLFIKEGL
ncbi:MAG: LptF/LptG family permease [Alphaproteobacteria bacterium]|jgi:lipopolysaccharide export system permease protein|nr:LptF/LptG family permease [Alphaproteobacteria bacterium]